MWGYPVHPQHLLPCLQSGISVLSRKMSHEGQLGPLIHRPPAFLFAVTPQSSLLLLNICIQHFLETSFTFKASRMVSRLAAPCGRDGKLCDTFLLLATHPALVQCEVLKTAGKAESCILTDIQAGAEYVTVWGLIRLSCAWWNSSGGEEMQRSVLCLKNFSCQHLVWLLEWGARLPAVWGSEFAHCKPQCVIQGADGFSRTFLERGDWATRVCAQLREDTGTSCWEKVLGEREEAASGSRIAKSQVIPNTWIQKSPSLGRKIY